MMIVMTDEREWFTSAAGRRITATEIAELLNVSRRTATNRLTEGLGSDDLIAIARKLGVSPINALVELGKLTYDEVFEFLDSDGTLVASASPEELLRALAEEMLPLDDRIEMGSIAQAMVAKRDDLKARRNRKNTHVAPLSDDEIADAIREANERPQAAHTDDGIEYTEPELP